MVFFTLFPTNSFSQSNNCAATPTLTVGASCSTTNYNVPGTFTESGVSVSCGTSLRDGWYTFTTGASTTSISIQGTSNRRLGLAVYSGACGSLTEVPSACTIPNAANANLTNITVSPNTTYRLRLMRTNGPNSNDMTGTICIFDTTILTNFTCATATSLPCGTSNLAGTTVGSTGSTAHGSGCTMSNYGAWYTFVGDGQLTTITSVAGSGFDHEMSISSGSCGSLTNITCRDSGFTGGTESHTFSTTNGVTYYVYIAHYSDTGTTTGTFTISRSCSAPISNDNCAGAISVPVNPTRTCASTVNGTIFGASDSGVTGSGCGGTDDDDVWYSFVATASTHYIELLNVAGSTTDLYHAVYGGSCGSLGTALVCSDPNTSTVTGLTPGNTYYIQVYSWTSTSGQNTTFDLCVSTDPPCSGTPVAGTATTSPGSGNPGSSYIVSATGFTSNVTGLTFQWQYSTNGGTTWTNAGGATTSYSNYTATAPALGTTVLWQLIVTCTNSGLSATSSNGSFTSVNTINVPASGNNSVTCGTNIALYDNGGSTSNYSNSSDGYTILDAGVGATININGSYSTESSFDYINIYSGSGTGGTLLASYSGSGTINYTGAAGQTLTVEFTSDGSTTYSGFNLTVTYSGSCYTPCSGTPTGGTVSTNPNTGWPGSSYTVSATGMTLALNMTYQWQYSTDGGSTWTNAGASTTSYADYTATAPASGDVHWQLIVTCTNSSQSATSTTGVFVTMSVSDVATGCPNVVSGGLGLSGADPAPFNCTDTSTCVDLEATYLDLGETTDYIVEPILYNPPFAFDGLANPVSVNTDDVWSPLINLPFDFCFYGNTYNQCTIGSNGILSFNTALAGTSSGYSFSNNIPISGDPRLVENSIFGVFHDIDPGVGGEVGWELITLPTGCRALVASWHDVPMFSNNSILYTGMMVLYENSNIIEVYIENKEIDGTWNGGNAVVGIQNSTGTLATVPPGRNGLDTDWTTTNEAWRFVPNGTSIATLTWYEGSGVTGPVVGTTPVLNVCPSSTTTYTAEITYTLCDGTTLTETDETTVTVNGAKVWNGTVNNDWNNNNNWTPTGRPTALDCVVIPPTSNDPVISGTGYNGLGLNMSIQNDATLTVNSDNSVSITDWVNISTTGELVLDNSASLIQTNNIANSGAGNMLMDRDVNIRKLDYVYWSSPVTSFLSSSISPGTSTGLIWKWTPTVSGNGTGNAGNWVNGNEAMTVGKGYIVRGPNTYTSTLQNYTATFVGTPNNGDISIPITRGSYTSGATYQICATCTPATNLDDNWNLVGNPYPSSIDAIDFLTANTTIDGYIKVWTHGTLPSSATVDPFYESYVYNYTVGDYITYNSTGTSSGPGMFNGYIAAGQGFFVSMLDGGPSTKNLNFTNSFRSNTYDNSQFFKNSTNEKHRIWLDIIAPNNNSTRALVGYVSDATYDKDRLFDAKTDNKIDLNLYSLISDETFTIQGRPTPFDENDIVPLGFKVPSTGIYSIGIAALDGLFENTNQAIFIQDLELNIIHDLRSMPYTFNANQGENNTRFNLIYKNSLSTEETINNENNVWVSAFDNLVVNSNNQNIISVKVFDILGRVLTNKTNISNKTVELNELLKTNSGLILEITLENNKVIYKKTIF
ncbi:hypothetical protein KK2020170_12820 [Flavobacterium okayamense]|uniref:CUB domain-containing protein n=1 Tax=Flavobacterium okayamense TaxID=2830782 RepID=A0ABM7S5V3_9FLAO|nr:hypothetical protein KK2020170_12820 [Flavobacterium okayamense]